MLDFRFMKLLSEQTFFNTSISVSSFDVRVTKPPWPDPSMKRVRISWAKKGADYILSRALSNSFVFLK